MALNALSSSGFLTPGFSYQMALTPLILGLLSFYWFQRILRQKPPSFKHVGRPWIHQLLPGQSSMTWTIEKYVEEGYLTVKLT